MTLTTTVVGSYPQPDWLIDRERLGARLPPRVRALELWRVDAPFLEEAQDDATRLAVQDMERAGVDVITDGEMRRESYSNRFATALDGVDLDNPGVALDRTGHENPVPRVVGPIRRTRPVEVGDVEFLRSITDRRIKITVPGPFTMTQQAQDDHYGDGRALALAYAEAVNEELRDLKAAGADVVQIDEPYLQARPEPAREYAFEAINRALDGIEGDTVLHTCFGYAHIVKQRLTGYPFLRELDACRATHVSLEAAQPGLDPEVLRDLPSKVDRPRRPRPGLARGRDAGARRRADPPRARGGRAGAARRRAGLRDEVPAARAGLPQAPGDGRRRAHRERGDRRLSRYTEHPQGRLAQLGEHQLDKLGVTGSSPVPPTSRKPRIAGLFSRQVNCRRSNRLSMPSRRFAAHRAGTIDALAQAVAVIVIPPRAFCRSVTVTSLVSSSSAAAMSSRIFTANASQKAPSFR